MLLQLRPSDSSLNMDSDSLNFPDGVKALVFDCDGTLIDSMPLHYDAWKENCDDFGLQFSRQLLVETAGKNVQELLSIIIERSDVASAVDRDEFFKRLMPGMYEKHHRPAEVIEPVMRIVRAGRKKGLPMAVASAGTRKHVQQSLEEAGITAFFDAVVCGDDVKNGKPAPDLFLLAAEKLGMPPKVCIGYEDAKLGMEAIQNAGFMAAVDVTAFHGYPKLV
ncbi:hypothetical protein CEUSTIGMA_g7605.t1 [Chlamydomonas eustigma]|uniref:Uncharacterized protein n=1 Tax=Chlamydomonas eustigma TaxID=1157962 RepID=A0A250XAR6_9CHLO|nr:hypothetical protein CEUSTIGMA_g7605.t1 [Chlamydomonas eustigma]|eukprot:GAX80167.1 hypothetical protein CEUSTIGMA_g7605.t1 [Chlamydomonas eustigma]